MKSVWLFFVYFLVTGTVFAKSLKIDSNQSSVNYREKRQFLSWLFGDFGRTDFSHHHQNHTGNNLNSTTNSTSSHDQHADNGTVRIGPFIFTNLKNSTLKRATLTPEFEKGLRDEIYRHNQEHAAAALFADADAETHARALSHRFKRRSGNGYPYETRISKRQGYFGIQMPQQQQQRQQQQMWLLQQAYMQQQAQAYMQQLLQQQLYGSNGAGGSSGSFLLNQNKNKNSDEKRRRRKRPKPQYEDYDDENENENENDDTDELFDSDEFDSLRSGI